MVNGVELTYNTNASADRRRLRRFEAGAPYAHSAAA